MMQNKISARLLQSLIKLDLIADADYQLQISELLDEQPYLVGFLFNLEEDFSEHSHDLLMRATLALRNSLSDAGLFFNIITPQMLEGALQKNVAAFEKLETEEAELDENLLAQQVSSPVALKELLHFVTENTNNLDLAEYNNIVLVLSAIIELFEQAATVSNPEGESA